MPAIAAIRGENRTLSPLYFCLPNDTVRFTGSKERAFHSKSYIQWNRPRTARPSKYMRGFAKEAVLYPLTKHIHQKKLDFNNIYWVSINNTADPTNTPWFFKVTLNKLIKDPKCKKSKPFTYLNSLLSVVLHGLKIIKTS